MKTNKTLMTKLTSFTSILSIAIAVLVVGCKDATRAQFNALGKRHRITLYGCDGKVIKEWISTGNVSNQEHSDGWYFEDEATHLLVEVAGPLVIEVIP
jgi:hypothetical protein